MRVWSTAGGSEAVDALSVSVASCDSAVRSAVRWCPAAVFCVDRAVSVGAPPGAVERRDRAGPGRLDVPQDDRGSPLGRRHRPLAEGARRFVASGYRPCVWPTRVAFIDGIPSSSRHASHSSARAVGLPITTESDHEDASENPCKPVGGAAHAQHRRAVPRASGGCPGSAGSLARPRAGAPLSAYIGRNRWPKARLTFKGRCSPRTARL